MTETKHTISSFAAPTAEDLASFDSLSDEQKRELIEAELDKSVGGEPIPLTSKTSAEISARVRARLKALGHR